MHTCTLELYIVAERQVLFFFFASHSALAALVMLHVGCLVLVVLATRCMVMLQCWPPPAGCHGQVLRGHAPCSTAHAACHGQVLHGRGPCWTPPAGSHGQVLRGRGPCCPPPAGCLAVVVRLVAFLHLRVGLAAPWIWWVGHALAAGCAAWALGWDPHMGPWPWLRTPCCVRPWRICSSGNRIALDGTLSFGSRMWRRT